MKEREEGKLRPELILAILLSIAVLLMIVPRFWIDGKSFGIRFLLETQRVSGSLFEQAKEVFETLGSIRQIRKKQNELLTTISEYEGLEREVVELRRENDILRRQLHLAQTIKYKHLAAQVIAGDPTNLFPAITLNKGAFDGVEEGMAVTAFQNGFFGLVGKVIQVGLRSSKVRLIVDPDNFVAARLARTRLQGLVEGKGFNTLLMRYVRKDSRITISVNELVVTSGMQSIYPPGIYIGHVKEVRSRDYMATLDIVLNPVINFDSVEYVYIILESNS